MMLKMIFRNETKYRYDDNNNNNNNNKNNIVELNIFSEH